MPNLSIKDVPEPWAEALRQRAARNHRSLQGELLAMVEQFIEGSAPSISLNPRLSVQEVYQRTLLRHPKPDLHGPQSVDIIRQDRDSR
jgi:antitoxin FitA